MEHVCPTLWDFVSVHFLKSTPSIRKRAFTQITVSTIVGRVKKEVTGADWMYSNDISNNLLAKDDAVLQPQLEVLSNRHAGDLLDPVA